MKKIHLQEKDREGEILGIKWYYSHEWWEGESYLPSGACGGVREKFLNPRGKKKGKAC